MKEREFQQALIVALESVGGLVFNIHGHRFQKGGIPDFYCAVGAGAIGESWSGWIEVKVGQGKPSGLQVMRMRDLLRRDVESFVVRWLDGNVYCELWYDADGSRGEGYEVLSCDDGSFGRSKGMERGKGLVRMLRNAGDEAVRLIVLAGKGGAL